MLPPWPSLSPSRTGSNSRQLGKGGWYRGGAVKKRQCNLGVKLWFLKGCVCVCEGSVVSDSLWPQGLKPNRPLRPWDFPGKNTGMGYHFLLQGIFDPEAERMSPVGPALACRFLPGSTCVYMVMYSPSSRGTYVTVSLSCFADTETLLGGRS